MFAGIVTGTWALANGAYQALGVFVHGLLVAVLS